MAGTAFGRPTNDSAAAMCVARPTNRHSNSFRFSRLIDRSITVNCRTASSCRPTHPTTQGHLLSLRLEHEVERCLCGNSETGEATAGDHVLQGGRPGLGPERFATILAQGRGDTD